MKVIVQDMETGAFLSVDGRWVATKAEARDFYTLMRAYAFAKDRTSRHFKILLHSPDDQYTASIISGVGTASPALAAFGGQAEDETKTCPRAKRAKKYPQSNRFNAPHTRWN